MTGGGGGGGRGSPTEVHNFHPKKLQLQILSTQKKSLLSLAYPKKSLNPFYCNPKKSLCFSFMTRKNPGVFHRPKKSLLAKIFRPKNSLEPPPPPHLPVIKICEWGPWGNDPYLKWLICSRKCAVWIICEQVRQRTFDLSLNSPQT